MKRNIRVGVLSSQKGYSTALNRPNWPSEGARIVAAYNLIGEVHRHGAQPFLAKRSGAKCLEGRSVSIAPLLTEVGLMSTSREGPPL